MNCAGGEGKGGGAPRIAAGLKPRPSGAPDQPPCVGEKFGLAARRHPGYGWWAAVQGSVLSGWLAVEVAMLRLVVWPHYLYGAVVLALVVTGLALARTA